MVHLLMVRHLMVAIEQRAPRGGVHRHEQERGADVAAAARGGGGPDQGSHRGGARGVFNDVHPY